VKENFDKSLKMILHHEGGYVNHPRDPGGETNLGVTKRVYEEWGGTKDMRDLTQEDVAPIYEKNYWGRAKCDHLPSGLDLAVFDWAVNSGVGRAAKKLQTMIGTEADGGIGPNTLRTLDEYIEHHGIEETLRNYKAIRQKFYESLSTFDTFGKGWTKRNEMTLQVCLEMI
jgi:lysozyme family protein|tara:strand:- start:1321 stop:1830 length:510 start_codon:yes stop_codon:yes gene_type:complete